MFKYFQEIHDLKKTKLQLEVILLSKLHDIAKIIDGTNDILELAKNMQDAAPEELVNTIVGKMKQGNDADHNK